LHAALTGAALNARDVDHNDEWSTNNAVEHQEQPGATMSSRSAARTRNTKETMIDVSITVDGGGSVDVSTGIPFFDHMLSQLGKHGGFDLRVHCKGDLEIDTHHTIEDVGIALGETFREALGDKAGVRRFASNLVPLDEALIECALDLSGRPFLTYEVDPSGGTGQTFLLGEPGFDPQLTEEFWRAFVMAAMVTLHIRMKAGKNTHHIIEAMFKSVARALRDAVRVEGPLVVPSTKGTL
jgi:imidazoleglycerol-phosphate dehydratase